MLLESVTIITIQDRIGGISNTRCEEENSRSTVRNKTLEVSNHNHAQSKMLGEDENSY